MKSAYIVIPWALSPILGGGNHGTNNVKLRIRATFPTKVMFITYTNVKKNSIGTCHQVGVRGYADSQRSPEVPLGGVQHSLFFKTLMDCNVSSFISMLVIFKTQSEHVPGSCE